MSFFCKIKIKLWTLFQIRVPYLSPCLNLTCSLPLSVLTLITPASHTASKLFWSLNQTCCFTFKIVFVCLNPKQQLKRLSAHFVLFWSPLTHCAQATGLFVPTNCRPSTSSGILVDKYIFTNWNFQIKVIFQNVYYCGTSAACISFWAGSDAQCFQLSVLCLLQVGSWDQSQSGRVVCLVYLL